MRALVVFVDPVNSMVCSGDLIEGLVYNPRPLRGSQDINYLDRLLGQAGLAENHRDFGTVLVAHSDEIKSI